MENVTRDGIEITEMNWGPLSPPNNRDGKTTNFGKVTKATFKFSSLNRGSYRFIGYILPERK